MVEVLEFIFASPAQFLGTLALMLVAGISGSAILSPFGKPRTSVFIGSGIEVEDEEDGE